MSEENRDFEFDLLLGATQTEQRLLAQGETPEQARKMADFLAESTRAFLPVVRESVQQALDEARRDERDRICRVLCVWCARNHAVTRTEAGWVHPGVEPGECWAGRVRELERTEG